MNCSVGIKISTDKISYIIMSETGRKVNFGEEKYLSNTSTTEFLELLQSILTPILETPEYKIIGVGVAVPALVENGTVIGAEEQIPALIDVDLKAYLKAKFPIPIYVENDCTAFALCENLYGDVAEISNVIFVNIDHGVGGALKINGELYSSHHNRSGELGHMIIHKGGAPCGCGAKGCLEAYVSVPAFLNHYSKKLEVASYSVDLQMFEKAYKNGDEAAIDTMNWHLEHLTLGLSNIENLLGPERIVITSPLSDIDKDYTTKLNLSVSETALPAIASKLEITKAKLGEDAISLGAALLAFL
ncbi:ROK family protein [Thalassotalea sp. SU-HH00458]|uniref:ROK family protein n=1 Tax=Thalassotalea sp. SU-HH00458 TaxID=3127657 RepID=UPI00310A9667